MFIRGKKNKPNFIAPTETWCSERRHFIIAFNSEGLDLIETASRGKRGGGVGLYIRPDLQNKRPIECQYNHAQLLTISSQTNNGELTNSELKIF